MHRKAFRKIYGETIGECQRRLRLNKAESLLRKRDISLVNVALECGFANQAHLSRSFKCAFGSTLARYRADQKSDNEPPQKMLTLSRNDRVVRPVEMSV